jgi:hypothetical protein
MQMHQESHTACSKVHSKIFLSLFSKETLRDRERNFPSIQFRDYLVVGLKIDESELLLEAPGGITSVSLQEVHRFDSFVRNMIALQPHMKLLICAGDEPFRQIRTMLLVGCHLIISQGLGFEESFLALSAFRSFHPLFEKHLASLESLLRAVCCAKCLDWINFNLDVSEDCTTQIHMEEYIHYAR